MEKPWRHERPWGRFMNLAQDTGWKVKRLTVDPGQALSLQKHSKRMEVWIVAAGCAGVTVGDRDEFLSPGDTVIIPTGAMHRLENRGDGVLEVIEVQLGSYLGEDDIERFEDRYGRA